MESIMYPYRGVPTMTPMYIMLSAAPLYTPTLSLGASSDIIVTYVEFQATAENPRKNYPMEAKYHSEASRGTSMSIIPESTTITRRTTLWLM